MDSKMNCIDLDTKTREEAKVLARVDGEYFVNNTRISKHRCVANQTGISYINHNSNYNLVSFRVNENPFSLYVDKFDDIELEKSRPIDYSFPITCVSDSVNAYMSEYVNTLNELVNFESIEGDVVYKDKRTKEVSRYRGFRPFFNLPENSKSGNPSMIGHLRIETARSKEGSSNYQFIYASNDKVVDNICTMRELAASLKKYYSYKVFVKPNKIVSSYMYYGEHYKLLWQVCCMQELEGKTNEMDFIRRMVSTTKEDIPKSCDMYGQNEIHV